MKVQGYSKGPSFYVITTLMCNIQCPHCHVSAGPKLSGPPKETIVKIAENLPQKINVLRISGGDPLSDLGTTTSFLEALKIPPQKQIESIQIETNGIVLSRTKEPELKELFSLLLSLGVNEIEARGTTPYHLKQALPNYNGGYRRNVANYFGSIIRKLRKLNVSFAWANVDRKIAPETSPFHGLFVYLGGQLRDEGEAFTLPVGRAAALPSENHGKYCLLRRDINDGEAEQQEAGEEGIGPIITLDMTETTGRPPGMAYFCRLRRWPFGNLLERPFNFLWENSIAAQHPIIQAYEDPLFRKALLKPGCLCPQSLSFT